MRLHRKSNVDPDYKARLSEAKEALKDNLAFHDVVLKSLELEIQQLTDQILEHETLDDQDLKVRRETRWRLQGCLKKLKKLSL